MITSESTNEEFHRFFDEHEGELTKRLFGLILNRYRRTILFSLKRGTEIPPIWGKLKLPEATLYMLPIGIKLAKGYLKVSSRHIFMVMKDLRKQTPVFITNSKPHVIMYSAHAVDRYRERMELDPETEFDDICKHMYLNGCINTRVFGDMSKIYGTNINHREISIISLNGAYLGFADGKTAVFHGETFLSSEDLRNDQLFLNASKSEDLTLWKSTREAYLKGEITSKELPCLPVCYSSDIAVSDGKIIKLSPEEARLRNEDNKKAITDPERIKKQLEENRQRYKNKIQRKGYK